MTGFWVFSALVAAIVGIIVCIAYRARKGQKRYVPPPDYTAPEPLYYSIVERHYQPLSITVDRGPAIVFEPAFAAAPELTDCGNAVADATGTTDTWSGCDTGSSDSGGDTK